jgi:hypothetical protein
VTGQRYSKLSECTDLNSGLLLAGGVVVTGTDTLSDLLPKLSALPFALLLDRLDLDLLLGSVGVDEDGRRLGNCTDSGPLTLKGRNLLALVGELGFERVRLAGHPTWLLAATGKTTYPCPCSR